MVPAAFVVLDQLPLNSHGKVSRGDLPEPPAVRSHRPPRTSTETILCELFAEVLETAEVGVDDDFISLGGHSLNAVTFVGRVRSRLGVELPVGALFDEPTPARLAALVDTARPVRSDLRARCRRGVSPLSFPQRRLWFLHRLEGPSTVDNIAIKVGLTGDLDRAALAAALRDVVGRHESLRTTFAEIDGEPVQRAHSAADWPGLHVEAVGEGHLEATMSRATAQPFDLATEMPLRATLLVLEADRHVLVLLFHHIAVDGWSMLPLGRDIAEAYCARLSGVPPSWTPLPVQYADFAEWQREAAGDPAVSDDLAAGDLAYWYQALTNLPEDLALPFDHPREGGGSRVRSAVPIRLDPALHQGLVGLARSEGATLFMALHAGVAALLSRLGAGPDIPLGTPAIGRYDERLEDLVGFFVNTLVLRVGTGGDPGFADLIGRVRAADLAAFAHQETPFERLVEIVNPDRSLGRHPLFQVMLALNSGNNFALELPGLDVGAQTLGNVSRFDLNFGFTETFDAAGAPGGIRGDLQYDSHLFTRATAERIAGSLRRLLSAVVRDPTRPLRRILLTSEDERRAALGRTGRVESPSPALVHEMFERQVRRTPHAVAVSAGDAVLTYDELNHNANRLARHLAERGVGPEARVAIVLRPAPELVVAILAVLKAGGAYVPIDADYPADRLRFLLHDSRPELLITTSDLAESIAGPVPSLLWNGWNGSAAATYCGADLIDDERAGHLLPSHPAYVMYTSGSTGQPKGVVVEHRSLSAYLGPARTRYPGVDGATLLHVSISFDATVTSLYLPLISGGRVCIGSLMGQSDRHRDRGTLLKITPSHLDLLESLPAQASPTQGLIVGGEQLSGERLVTWRSRHPEVSVYNSYGPTEATVNCAEFALAPGQPAPVGAVPIGQPLPGARIYLLDSALHLVAPGMIGEMYVTGELIARGYLGQPALTAERFVADPFGPPGTRMYRTGDLARQLPDGNLQFVGRVDGQVKIRGVRIEPREVERALERHGSVRRAAVLAHDFGTRDTRLVAYVTPAPGQQVEPDELRRFAATVLPRHVVPAAVVPVVELPRTAGGKLDRAALPAPEPAAAPGVRPRGPWERQLCEIFADTLGVPVIGVEDPFFDLGGHSLLVPRLVERIRAAFGITLNIRDVFEAPTVAELATRLTRGASGDPLATLLPLRLSDPVNGRAILYCVHSVTGVSWTFAGLLRHLDSDRPVYGLQAPGLSRSTDAPASADELITALVNEICGTARDAPVCLVGWSVGGLIAHMLAVRLQREGRRVGALALLDSYPRLTTEADLVADRAAAPEGSDLWVDAFASIGDLVAGVSGVDHERVDRTLAMVRRLASVRPLGVFQGDVLLFVAADGTDHSYTPEMWAPYVSGSIETHLVDCSHHEMTRPDALAKIGPVLNDRMREVDLR
jgi:amino acid adenylation domain-containing protein